MTDIPCHKGTFPRVDYVTDSTIRRYHDAKTLSDELLAQNARLKAENARLQGYIATFHVFLLFEPVYPVTISFPSEHQYFELGHFSAAYFSYTANSEADITAAKKANKALLDEVAKLNDRLSVAQDQHKASSGKCAALMGERDAIKDRLEALVTSVKSGRSTHEETIHQLTTAFDGFKAASADREREHTLEVQKLQEQLQSAQDELSAVQRLYEESQQDSLAQQVEIVDMQSSSTQYAQTDFTVQEEPDHNTVESGEGSDDHDVGGEVSSLTSDDDNDGDKLDSSNPSSDDDDPVSTGANKTAVLLPFAAESPHRHSKPAFLLKG